MKRNHLILLALVLSALGLLIACAAPPTPVPPTLPPPPPTSAPAPVQPTAVPPTSAPAATKPPATAVPTAVPATVAPTAVPTASAPKVVRMRISRDPKTLEPGLFSELITGYIANDMHAELLRFDDKNQPAPYIAKSWALSSDGLTYTFTLRDDVKFQNGRKVVADDFVFTFTRDLDPNVKAAIGPIDFSTVKGAADYVAGKAKSVEGFQAPDATTFKIVLTQPDPVMPLRLASPFTAVIPKEAVVEGKPNWVGKPVGAGAFRYVDWQTNVKVVLEANPDYFLGKPKIDRLEYVVVPDATTAIAQYQKGELDIIGVSGAQLAQVNADATLSKELNLFPRAQLTFFVLNEKRVAAFKDPQVRQAFIYAINRQQLIDKVMLGDRFLATGYVPTGISEAVPNETAYPYDPAKAQDLMTKAGYPGGKGFPKIEFVTTADEGSLAEALTAMLKTNLGIDISVRIGESGDVLNGLWDLGKWDIVSWGWTADYPSADNWLYQLMYSKISSDFSSYNNPVYDKLVDTAMAETDPAKRIAAWQAVERMAYTEAPMIPFGFAKNLFLVKPYVKGFSALMMGPKRFETVDIVK